MELVKKVVIFLIIILLFGGFIYFALLIKNTMTAKDYSDYWQDRLFDGGNFTYVVLGDSTALGIGATSVLKGYPGLISDKIKGTGRSVKIVNLATKNATIHDVLTNQLPKVESYKPDLVTVTVGMEDVNKGTDIDADTQDLSNLTSGLTGHTSYIGEIPAMYDNNKDIVVQQINKQIDTLGPQNGVNVVPLYSVTYSHRFDITYYDWDFTHTNNKGYSLWADTFWTAIQ